jgi:hypothetical protein
MEAKELWKSSLNRYECLLKLFEDLNEGMDFEQSTVEKAICSSGSVDLRIPPCLFCRKNSSYCGGCEWGKEFGECESPDEDEDEDDDENDDDDISRQKSAWEVMNTHVENCEWSKAAEHVKKNIIPRILKKMNDYED